MKLDASLLVGTTCQRGAAFKIVFYIAGCWGMCMFWRIFLNWLTLFLLLDTDINIVSVIKIS